MEKQSIAVNPNLQTLSTADLEKKFAPDSTEKTTNLLFAQLLALGRREPPMELWRFFDIKLFLQVVTENFSSEQIAKIYSTASSIEDNLRQHIQDIEDDPEQFARYYTHEVDRVHNGVGLEIIRSEYIPNGEMYEMLTDLETYESITGQLLDHFDL